MGFFAALACNYPRFPRRPRHPRPVGCVGVRAGLSVDGWFWKSVKAGGGEFFTPMITRTAHTSDFFFSLRP
jgi:hypothetical protein